MTAITIRKLPEGTKQRLRMRAAANGRSMEAEARDILVAGLNQPTNVDLNWIEQLIQIGNDFPGERIPELPDEPVDYSEMFAE
ncbi:MAG: Arc family DNA-binding protein [Aeromicrobium sp.]|uniref:FitA-like ribbon-helix-helix domain-containing protein n=1 Tax=Aeromicrobium sp. TaxID=1871063 RepID=UPI0039E4AACD